MTKCDACGLVGGELIRVRTTNGGLCLCRQCLDDINRKNPVLVGKRELEIRKARAARATFYDFL